MSNFRPVSLLISFFRIFEHLPAKLCYQQQLILKLNLLVTAFTNLISILILNF
jgi:hypothetical protein